eukprot:gene22861-biopygen1216
MRRRRRRTRIQCSLVPLSLIAWYVHCSAAGNGAKVEHAAGFAKHTSADTQGAGRKLPLRGEDEEFAPRHSAPVERVHRGGGAMMWCELFILPPEGLLSPYALLYIPSVGCIGLLFSNSRGKRGCRTIGRSVGMLAPPAPRMDGAKAGAPAPPHQTTAPNGLINR